MSEAKIYYQEDCNLSLLDGKTIAIIGYGSQGHAHALNLKESGCNVIIGLYEGSKSWAKAEQQGFEVFTAAEAAKRKTALQSPARGIYSVRIFYLPSCYAPKDMFSQSISLAGPFRKQGLPFWEISYIMGVSIIIYLKKGSRIL